VVRGKESSGNRREVLDRLGEAARGGFDVIRAVSCEEIFQLKKLFLTSLTLSLTLVVGNARADSVYTIDVSATTADPTGNPAQSDTVDGSITTDGTIGVLQSSDIVSWDLDLIDNLNPVYDVELTPANSALVEDTGSALSATATGLFFDYSGSGEFLIQANSPGAFSGYDYFCFSTGSACLAGETIAPNFYAVDGVILTGQSGPTGTQPLAPTNSSTVPEPSSYAFALTGLLALGISLKQTFAKQHSPRQE
jgi:hypothetical protein